MTVATWRTDNRQSQVKRLVILYYVWSQNRYHKAESQNVER